MGATVRFGEAGGKATLTCTADNAASLTTVPSVTWFKDDASSAIEVGISLLFQ